MLTRCEEIMRKVCEDFEAELKEFKGERDHVHLLVHYRRTARTGRPRRTAPLHQPPTTIQPSTAVDWR
jgi:hypothetical protein